MLEFDYGYLGGSVATPIFCVYRRTGINHVRSTAADTISQILCTRHDRFTHIRFNETAMAKRDFVKTIYSLRNGWIGIHYITQLSREFG